MILEIAVDLAGRADLEGLAVAPVGLRILDQPTLCDIHTYIYIYIYMYICMYICKCVYTYVYICT